MDTRFCSACNDSHVCIPTNPNPRTRLAAPNAHAGVGTFITDACEIEDKHRCGGAMLYAAYVAWAAQEGLKPCGNRQFANTVQGHGFRRRLSGTVTYYGLRPKEDADWPKGPGEVGYLLPPVEDLSRSEDRQVNEGVR